MSDVSFCATAPLGIIAGRGTLPTAIAQATLMGGRSVVLCNVVGDESHVLHWASQQQDCLHANAYPRVICENFVITEAGPILALFRRHHVVELVLAGGVTRPTLRHLIPDRVGLRLLSRLLMNARSGDDVVLREVMGFLEEEGFALKSAHDCLSDITLGTGVQGQTLLPDGAEDDIIHGCSILRHMGPLDIGQAVVVRDRRVIAIEAAEGTDAMIERVGALYRVWVGSSFRVAQQSDRGSLSAGVHADLHHDYGGVLVKCPKRNQDRRADLPTIGPNTFHALHHAGVSVIAADAYETIIVDRPTCLDLANRYGIALYGIDSQRFDDAI